MNTPTITLRQATLADLDALVPLFDGYRVFYRQASDPDAARRFLQARFENGQSVLFMAQVDGEMGSEMGGEAAGFAQLYPSFSSVSMARIFILNDLFVAPAHRQHGLGTRLLAASADYARAVGAIRLTLTTELSNTTAQAVYEAAGWRRDEVFYTYHLQPL
jgi:GNAT superfamily N-acetyltransferase